MDDSSVGQVDEMSASGEGGSAGVNDSGNNGESSSNDGGDDGVDGSNDGGSVEPVGTASGGADEEGDPSESPTTENSEGSTDIGSESTAQDEPTTTDAEEGAPSTEMNGDSDDSLPDTADQDGSATNEEDGAANEDEDSGANDTGDQAGADSSSGESTDDAGDADGTEPDDSQNTGSEGSGPNEADDADDPTEESNHNSGGSESDNSGDETPINDDADESSNDATATRDRYPEGPFFPDSDVVSNLTFELEGGAPFTLESVRRNENAKVLVLYSGVAWCGSCRSHMIQYGAMLDRLSDRGLAVVSVVREAYDGSLAQGAFVAAYARNNGLTYDVVADPSGVLNPFVAEAQRIQPGAFRIAMVIDLDSMTLLHIGQIAPSAVEQLVEPLLAAP